MIAFLKGTLHQKTDHSVVIDCQGVGYAVRISSTASQALPKTGEPVQLSIYHHITENDQQLFGFLEDLEKSLFERLITVKGVGPKLALTILSGTKPDLLIGAIQNNQAGLLAKTPGIGNKTAERIILELKDKAGDLMEESKSPQHSSMTASFFEELISGLLALGYKQSIAERTAHEVVKNATPDATTSLLLKEAIKRLNL